MSEKTAVPDIKHGALVLYLGAEDGGFGRLRVAHETDAMEEIILGILESAPTDAKNKSVADAIEALLEIWDGVKVERLVKEA